MTVLDANILIYAWNKDSPHHPTIRNWVEDLFSGEDRVGIPWVTVWAFLRLTTNPRVVPNPITADQAFDIVDQWLASPNVVMLHPESRHAEILRKLVVQSQATGPLLTDAVLAAIAIEQGATLASTDQDFSRFNGLSWTNPLVNGKI